MLKSFAASLVLCLPLLAWATDVNKANEAELDSVKGLGPSSTARILKAREQGPFKDWADFIGRVGGVGNKSAVNFSKEGLTVNGKKYSAAAAAKAEAKSKHKEKEKTASHQGSDRKAHGSADKNATAPATLPTAAPAAPPATASAAPAPATSASKN